MINIIDHDDGNLRSIVSVLAKMSYRSLVTVGSSDVLDAAHLFYSAQCTK